MPIKIESLDYFLKWQKDKNIIVFSFESKSFNYLEDVVDEISFYSPGSDQFLIKCPIIKKDNQIFLRIIRKCLFEMNKKILISDRVKEFLNFIPGKFINVSEIYDLTLLNSINGIIYKRNKENLKSLLIDFKKIIKSISQKQLDFYLEILENLILCYSEIEKHGLISNNGCKLYSYYDLCGSVTGRLTNSSFDSNKFINPLNLPKDMRNIIKSKENHNLIISDYNAMEMRILSYISQDENLISIFDSGKDVYTLIAKDLFNIIDIDYKKRQEVKDLCFHIIYGGTEYGLSKQNNYELSYSKNLIDNFFNMFPKVKKFIDNIHLDIISKSYCENLFGRKRIFNNINKNNLRLILRQGQNFLIQSCANDICMSALLELNKELDDDSHIIIHVHDSIVVDSPIEKTKKNIELIKNIMTNPNKIKKFGINNIKLNSNIKISTVWE